MKKLMIAACSVALAAVAQAATLNWNIFTVPVSPASSTKSDFTAYLFQTAGTDLGKTTTLNAIKDALKSTTSFSEFVTTYGAVQGVNLNVAGTVSGATGVNGNNWGAGDSFTGLALILDGTIDDAENYMLTGVQTATFESASGAQNLGFGSQASNTWEAYPVPEPFSGTLALLGMGVVALRRKMKKAKGKVEV